MIQPVPRDEAERLFPDLIGQQIWGDQPSYDMAQCAKIHYVVYGPLDTKTLIEANRLFKSVRVVNKDKGND